ncbi:hypothetical protein CB1_000218025 [Camelus ferus]|nr:hypothetical protein CB1_000218025 [Camelus ferus]
MLAALSLWTVQGEEVASETDVLSLSPFGLRVRCSQSSLVLCSEPLQLSSSSRFPPLKDLLTAGTLPCSFLGAASSVPANVGTREQQSLSLTKEQVVVGSSPPPAISALGSDIGGDQDAEFVLRTRDNSACPIYLQFPGNSSLKAAALRHRADVNTDVTAEPQVHSPLSRGEPLAAGRRAVVR